MAPGFDIVFMTVIVLAIIVGLLLGATSIGAYQRIGDDGSGPAPAMPPSRDDEIRQMLEARNARRIARGQAALDIDDELRRLEAAVAPADPALRDEVRQLVEARNARRAARGQEPLDVETETERRLRDVGRG